MRDPRPTMDIETSEPWAENGQTIQSAEGEETIRVVVGDARRERSNWRVVSWVSSSDSVQVAKYHQDIMGRVQTGRRWIAECKNLLLHCHLQFPWGRIIILPTYTIQWRYSDHRMNLKYHTSWLVCYQRVIDVIVWVATVASIIIITHILIYSLPTHMNNNTVILLIKLEVRQGMFNNECQRCQATHTLDGHSVHQQKQQDSQFVGVYQHEVDIDGHIYFYLI